MSLGDVTLLDEGAFGGIGARRYTVLLGTLNSIKAGEPVQRQGGPTFTGTYVFPLQDAAPVVAAGGTNWGATFMAGVASSTSTDTTTANGTVDVLPLVPGVVYLVAPTTAATWDTQAEYDALVGKFVTLARSATGVYTINATHNLANGCVVEPLEIAKYPGKVAFTFRNSVSYTN